MLKLKSNSGHIITAALSTIALVALFFISANHVVKLTANEIAGEGGSLRSELASGERSFLEEQFRTTENCQMIGDVCYSEHKVGQLSAAILGKTFADKQAYCYAMQINGTNNYNREKELSTKVICYTQLAQEKAREAIDIFMNNINGHKNLNSLKKAANAALKAYVLTNNVGMEARDINSTHQTDNKWFADTALHTINAASIVNSAQDANNTAIAAHRARASTYFATRDIAEIASKPYIPCNTITESINIIDRALSEVLPIHTEAWQNVIRSKYSQYGDAASRAISIASPRMYKLPNSSDSEHYIKAWQIILCEYEFYPCNRIDGEWGTNTQNAVNKFNEWHYAFLDTNSHKIKLNKAKSIIAERKLKGTCNNELQQEIVHKQIISAQCKTPTYPSTNLADTCCFDRDKKDGVWEDDLKWCNDTPRWQDKCKNPTTNTDRASCTAFCSGDYYDKPGWCANINTQQATELNSNLNCRIKEQRDANPSECSALCASYSGSWCTTSSDTPTDQAEEKSYKLYYEKPTCEAWQIYATQEGYDNFIAKNDNRYKNEGNCKSLQSNTETSAPTSRNIVINDAKKSELDSPTGNDSSSFNECKWWSPNFPECSQQELQEVKDDTTSTDEEKEETTVEKLKSFGFGETGLKPSEREYLGIEDTPSARYDKAKEQWDKDTAAYEKYWEENSWCLINCPTKPGPKPEKPDGYVGYEEFEEEKSTPTELGAYKEELHEKHPTWNSDMKDSDPSNPLNFEEKNKLEELEKKSSPADDINEKDVSSSKDTPTEQEEKKSEGESKRVWLWESTTEKTPYCLGSYLDLGLAEDCYSDYETCKSNEKWHTTSCTNPPSVKEAAESDETKTPTPEKETGITPSHSVVNLSKAECVPNNKYVRSWSEEHQKCVQIAHDKLPGVKLCDMPNGTKGYLTPNGKCVPYGIAGKQITKAQKDAAIRQAVAQERARQEAARKAKMREIEQKNAAARKKAQAQQKKQQAKAKQKQQQMQKKLDQKMKGQQDEKKLYEPKCAITASDTQSEVGKPVEIKWDMTPAIAISKTELKYHNANHEEIEEAIAKSGSKTITPTKVGTYKAEIRVTGYFDKKCQDTTQFNVVASTVATTTTTVAPIQGTVYAAHTPTMYTLPPAAHNDGYSWYNNGPAPTAASFARVYATPNPLYVGGQARIHWQGVGTCSLSGFGINEEDLYGNGEIVVTATPEFERGGAYPYTLRCGAASSSIVVTVLHQPVTYSTSPPVNQSINNTIFVPQVTEQVTERSTSTRCPIFTQYLKRGVVNSHVSTVEGFLQRHGYFNGAPDNIFNVETENAVKRFQAAHSAAILVPWGHTEPTGYWYKTSRSYANKLMGCTDPTFNPDLGDTL
mgnify:CR=1 FL=1